MAHTPEPASLSRKIGLPLVTFYGLGAILGAGIYVLVGKVAGLAGLFAPLAFLTAALIAAVTALSYAQLVALFPKSAGESVYVWQGFHHKSLSATVGWMIILTGIVSSATLSNGAAGYVNVFVQSPRWLCVVITVLMLGGLALWGISESMWASAVMTVIELGGLLLVLVFSGDALLRSPARASEFLLPTSMAQWGGVLSAAFLAFYAFIGFEDMVNVAEEVKNPEKNLPPAILIAIGAATLLYVLVAVAAVSALPLETLSASDAPLALLIESRGATWGKAISAISIFAILNGLLVQIVMASRVFYGMADQGNAPAFFSQIHPKTRTPLAATLATIALVLIFALWLPLVVLAKITSFVILIIFTLVNMALWRIKKDPRYADQMTFKSYPVFGALLCFLLVFFQMLTLIR
ncbi:MAG: APC family permease [Nitrospiria bacterium]